MIILKEKGNAGVFLKKERKRKGFKEVSSMHLRNIFSDAKSDLSNFRVHKGPFSQHVIYTEP